MGEGELNKYYLEPAQWVKRYGDVLYNYAVYRVFSSPMAEDLVQETFLSAFDARESFKGNSTERTWLIAILKRKIIDYFRKKSQKDNKEISEEYHYFNPEGEAKKGWIAEKLPEEWSLNIEQVIENKELYDILNRCLSHLPAQWAACFSLKSIEEIPSEEVCKEMDITPSNLWVILHRARLKLRECFEKFWMK